MQFDNKGKIVINKKSFEFPNLLKEGRKYGLSEEQISLLAKYLNDKRLLRLINLETFNRDARAWLAALTGIVAEVLAMDAHVTIWLDKKLEKPRNWILNKINNIIPTKIDDVAIKALQLAQKFTDDELLPLKEKLMSNISSKMHDKYEYNSKYTYLGNSLKYLKEQAKLNLKESKYKAKEAKDTLNARRIETQLIGGYHDKDGNFINMRKYGKSASKTITLIKGKEKQNARERREERERRRKEGKEIVRKQAIKEKQERKEQGKEERKPWWFP